METDAQAERNGLEKAKCDQLKQKITVSEADVVGITELGCNEYNMPYYSRPPNVAKIWVENGISKSTLNRRNNLSMYEPGGVMSLTRDQGSTPLRGKVMTVTSGDGHGRRLKGNKNTKPRNLHKINSQRLEKDTPQSNQRSSERTI